MTIFEEVKQMFAMILDHHEDLERLDFTARMKNGAVVRYNYDRRKIERRLEQQNRPHRRRETFNAVLDVIGIAVSISFLTLLLIYGISRGTPIHVMTFVVYGTLLVLYFLFCALYHFLTDIMKIQDVFRKLVELFSFFLIAGTYVPVFMNFIRSDGPGWALLGAVWALAVLGIFFRYHGTRFSNSLAEIIAVLMIWVFVPALASLPPALGSTGMTWLLLGAAFYSLWRVAGLLRRKNETPDEDVVKFDISNLFVLFANFFYFLIMVNLIG
jgi:hemolysin III